MFRETSPQRPLFGVESLMRPVKQARLEQSWAQQYRDHALPLIDEKPFAPYFDPENGRPNKSVRLVVTVLILKEMFDFTDEEALAQLEWNLLWHYALDILPEDAHTCQKTLHNFRKRLLDEDEGAHLFESTTARLIKAAGLRTGRQRQDSTHIVSNIRLLTRLGLFVDTITQFLKTLRKEHPGLYAEIEEGLAGKYLDREGYFADARSTEARRRLKEAAVDLYWLVTTFEAHDTVKEMPSFKLAARLCTEQCVVPDGESADCIELQKKPDSSSLQSPSDPDATYGHKGKGYEVQLAETCEEENGFQALTAVEVHGANESDQHYVEPILDQTERTCGKTPNELDTDSGYASGENILKAQERGTELVTPIGSKESEKHLPMRQFEFDAQGERVLRCPAGKAPVKHKPNRTGSAVLACFSTEQCDRCPLREQCPTEQRRGELRVLSFTRADVAVARRRVEQETPEFKERYKIRSGIEATNSELKRCHGLAKLRVRRRKRVGLSVRLKALALNFKRYVNHLTEIAVAATPAPACTC